MESGKEGGGGGEMRLGKVVTNNEFSSKPSVQYKCCMCYSPSQNISVLDDGELRWSSVSNLQDASPLGEISAVLFVLLAAIQKAVETLSGALVISTGQWDHAFVHFDSDLNKSRKRMTQWTSNAAAHPLHIWY